MGILEKESRQRAKRGEIGRVVLGTVAAAGILGIALVAPNALKALRGLGIDVSGRKKEIVNRSRKKLVEMGMLAYTPQGHLRLTEKGKEKLFQMEVYRYQILPQKKWDKKWRVLIFDIKEERKPLREKVRRTLLAIGFVRLQDSVWVYPYDCEDIMTLLKADFKIGKELLYLIVDRIEYDQHLRDKFGLPR